MKRNRNPRYVKQYRDSAGNWINQYRRGGKLIRLPNGRDFSEGWWEAYYEAERHFLAGEVQQIGQTRTTPNSVDAALVGYYRSTAFRNLAANSQRAFRQSLERDFRPTYGNARIGHLRAKHVIDIIAEKAAASPTGARQLLAAIPVVLRLLRQCRTDRAKPDGRHQGAEGQVGRPSHQDRRRDRAVREAPPHRQPRAARRGAAHLYRAALLRCSLHGFAAPPRRRA